MRIVKRNGQLAQFDSKKIFSAAKKALLAVNTYDGNSQVELAVRMDGVNSTAHTVTKKVVENVEQRMLEAGSEHAVSVETVQDFTEKALIAVNEYDAARAFIRYRDARARVRTHTASVDPLSLNDYVSVAKYARFLPEKGRREVRSETVDRSRQMHLDHFANHINSAAISKLIKNAFVSVDNQRATPSMRCMQFGGEAIEVNNVRLYNCGFTLANRTRVFQEIFWCLLSGTGMGFSVRHKHVKHLLRVKSIDTSNVVHHTVEDTIEGWADALGALINSYFHTGALVEFNYSDIRSVGSLLKTSGGIAPGHVALRVMLETVRSMLNELEERSLRPVNVCDIVCHIAIAVRAGGIRRSSLICIFDMGDTEMLYCKSPGNFDLTPGQELNSQRRMANMSAALPRESTAEDEFKRVIEIADEGYGGEPGAYWEDNEDCGPNPCVEIGMDPVMDLAWEEYEDNTHLFDWKEYAKSYKWQEASNGKQLLKDNRESEFEFYDPAAVYGAQTGVVFCNLTGVNVAMCRTEDEFRSACKAASVIGTLQAAYTTFPYLGPVTETIVRRDALLGVSLTGIYDRPRIGLNPDMLRAGAELVVGVNRFVSDLIGTRPAARCTAVKPSGTESLVLSGVTDDDRTYSPVASGAHPHHADRYFRRVVATSHEPPAQAFLNANPHAVERKANGELALVFPVIAPDGVPTVKSMSAVQHASDICTLYDNWIVPGWQRGRTSHNVSCTVCYAPEEHKELLQYMWDNRARMGAMTIMPKTSDKAWPHAPREEVSTDADQARWEELVTNWKKIDWSKEDVTAQYGDGIHADGRSSTSACEGAMCEINRD